MMNADGTRYFLAALILVERDGKLLLIKESKIECRNKWFLPGGRAELGESILQSAVREAKEESGLEIELTGLLYLDQLSDPDPAGGGNRIRFVFLGKPGGGELKTSEDEHSICAAWFSDAETATLEMRSPIVRTILQIRRENPAILPISRIHVITKSDANRERP